MAEDAPDFPLIECLEAMILSAREQGGVENTQNHAGRRHRGERAASRRRRR
jgi:hypothetical protein